MKSILALLLLACSTAALAQKPPAACGLVTPAQLTSILGMKAGDGRETDMVIQGGVFKGQTSAICTWPVPQGTILVSVLRVASPAQRAAGLAEMQKNRQQLQAMLKQQGWTTAEANIGGFKCMTATPPAALAAQKAPTGTTCTADVVKGLALSVGTSLLGAKTPPAKMKTLYDTITKRF